MRTLLFAVTFLWLALLGGCVHHPTAKPSSGEYEFTPAPAKTVQQ